jgi:hypothetical protein
MKVKIKGILVGLVLGFSIAAIISGGLSRQAQHKSQCQVMLSSGYCVR